MKGIVKHHDQTALQDLGGGTTRRVLAYDGQLMAVEVGFEAGALLDIFTPMRQDFVKE